MEIYLAILFSVLLTEIYHQFLCIIYKSENPVVSSCKYLQQ